MPFFVLLPHCCLPKSLPALTQCFREHRIPESAVLLRFHSWGIFAENCFAFSDIEFHTRVRLCEGALLPIIASCRSPGQTDCRSSLRTSKTNGRRQSLGHPQGYRSSLGPVYRPDHPQELGSANSAPDCLCPTGAADIATPDQWVFPVSGYPGVIAISSS